jgi:hypothetical protein
MYRCTVLRHCLARFGLAEEGPMSVDVEVIEKSRDRGCDVEIRWRRSIQIGSRLRAGAKSKLAME